MAEGKRRLCSLLESSAIGVVCWSAEGDLLDANDTFLRILGHSRDDLEHGRVRWREVAPLPPPAWGAHELLSGAVRPLINRQYLRPDGRAVSLLVAAEPWSDRGGAVALVFDVTLRVGLEEQLLHWQKMEAIGRIAGGVSHDCNNFLTVILGYADNLLRQPDISAGVRADAVEIQRAGDRAATLMQQLLAYGRKHLPSPVVLCLNDVVAEIADMLRTTIGETTELCPILATPLDNVFADQGQIEQVIVNLIVNARDAMPDGGTITLRTTNVTLASRDAERWPDCEPGRYVLLSVEDKGTGITEEIQARVFEPFFTTKECGRGAGLGLAIVSGIVRQCRGCVTVSSDVGRGTTFNVYLPRADVGAAPPAIAALPLPLAAGHGAVLVVEDDPGVRRSIETTLLSCGYRVHVAANGGEALRYCQGLTTPLRLVLTDVVMPKISGRQLGELLRVLLPATKVLYMTGYDDPAADDAAPADAILRKPFSPSTLAWSVHRLLADSADSRLA
jgi:PAS domain S-box-containing protein